MNLEYTNFSGAYQALLSMEKNKLTWQNSMNLEYTNFSGAYQ